MRVERFKRFPRRPGQMAAKAARWVTADRRRLLPRLALLLCLLGGGAFLGVWAGLVSVSASSGHWPITYWFLHFAMRNAVETQSAGIEIPALDPALAFKGAGHYATGCAPCHGAPGQARSLIARQMTPAPPLLTPRVLEWEPEELFWIVRNGVKFTAMPAWPSLQREDEVWAMVVFLRQLPDMSPERYRSLAYGETAGESAGAAGEDVFDPAAIGLRALSGPAPEVLADCARCHGREGNGRGEGFFPKLAGQTATYLLASMRAYARGARHSGIMRPVAAGLDEESMRALAGHYAALPRNATAAAGETAALARGRIIAERGMPAQGVPSCADCHGPRQGPRNPNYPILAGQYADYLELQLQLFKNGRRGGTPYAHIMNLVAGRLSSAQMRDVALYYSSVDP